MADQKISQLTTKTTPTTSDVLPIVDAAASDNKKITIGTLPVSTPVQTAINAKVQDSITDGVTTVAPSQNAVFDALALKQNSLGFTPENVANKETTALDTSTTKYPANSVVKAAVDLKADASSLSSHVSDTSNPHSVTKAQVGLGNVDNTSDVNKPISSATQTALNAKQDTLVSGTNIKTINGSSILGSGNLVVSGGGSAAWGGITGTLSDQTDLQSALNAKQDSLGYTAENAANKATSLTSPDNVKYPTTQAVSTALSGKQDSLGFTPENVANKENTALDTSATKYPTNNLVKTYVDTGLSGKQNTIGFTPENVANKSTNTSLGTSDTLYPSQNAVKVYADTKIAKAAGATYTVNNVLAVTAAEYAAIATPDANTVYFIV